MCRRARYQWECRRSFADDDRAKGVVPDEPSRFVRLGWILVGIVLLLFLVVPPASAYNRMADPATSIPVQALSVISPDVTVSRTILPVSSAGQVPSILHIAPDQGSIDGGTQITIAGSRLGRGSKVMFDTILVTNVTWISPTTLRVITPPHEAGSVAVTVTTPRRSNVASSRARFTYRENIRFSRNTAAQTTFSGLTPAPRQAKCAGISDDSAEPVIAAISPVNGSANGGTCVTITGTRLGRGSKVRFGSIPATAVIHVSPTMLIVTAPPHAAGPVDIIITTPRGTSDPSSVGRFTYA